MLQNISTRKIQVKWEGKCTLSPVMKRIYMSRNIDSLEKIDLSLSKMLNYKLLKDIEAAAEFICTFITSKKNILIIGDYDADGATSTALAISALKKLGAENVNYLVPNRFKYGYGLSPEIVIDALSYKPDLIITVDNGISSCAGVATAKENNIAVVVTDHHLAPEILPNADYIINPNKLDDQFPSKCIAGVGVIFYLMIAIRNVMRTQNLFNQLAIKEPNLAQFLDLVALGTIADVVPLDYNNRILVKYGMQLIEADKTRPGIRALLNLSPNPITQLTASDLSFKVAPKLNAAGRLEDMSLGIACLLADLDSEATEIAHKLNNLNIERRSIEAKMSEQAMRIAESIQVENTKIKCLCLYNKSWHEGVIGIVASRLKERYHCPVIIFTNTEKKGEIKASARSVTGYHIRDALHDIDTKNPGIIIKFGGHAMAAGLSIKLDDLAIFREQYLKHVGSKQHLGFLDKMIETDGKLNADEISMTTALDLIAAEPWGSGFPEPCFQGNFKVIGCKVLKEKHLKLNLTMPDGYGKYQAIYFNADHYIDLTNLELITNINIVYRLNINEFMQKKTIQLLVESLQIVYTQEKVTKESMLAYE